MEMGHEDASMAFDGRGESAWKTNALKTFDCTWAEILKYQVSHTHRQRR